jgi:hypothetical protein
MENNNQEITKALKFTDGTGNRILSRESSVLEFKESFNWGSKDRYAKIAAAFANNRGGSIIFGVKNDPRELSGLQSENFNNIDEAIISQYFSSVLSPEIEFSKLLFRIRNKNVGVINIKSIERGPVVAIKNDGEIKEGDIYYRYNARNDKIKFPELQKIIDQIKDQERKYWKSIFEKISRIGPENTALLDIVDGTIEGKSGSLFVDSNLIKKIRFIQEGRFIDSGKPTLKLIGDVRPVSVVGRAKSFIGGKIRITDDIDAPELRINESEILKQFPLDYSSLTSSLKARYSDFKVNKKYHEIRKKIMTMGFSFNRKLNPKKEKSVEQDFYSPRIYKEFDKYYKKSLNSYF